MYDEHGLPIRHSETVIALDTRPSSRSCWRSPQALSFDTPMFATAIDAFARYGKGRGHPADPNFGDRLSYAVAGTRALPLLFKGNDFVHTDLVPARSPTP